MNVVRFGATGMVGRGVLRESKSVTTAEQIGRAMLLVAKHGAAKRVLENDDINAAASRKFVPHAQ
jgi:hypothetical protein